MTITLPEELRDELERKAKANGFASVSEYIAELVQADDSPISVPEARVGARYAVRTPEELTAKLLEGMDTSGDVLAGPDFWERRRQAAEARFAGEQPK
ncbi:MAG: ribbon-helix-helix domain-containing protein [Planctomycetes bacterium]|nr:ribbon-helix-helix domain-containing protein [Planctomycetota bacterium]